MSKALRFGGKSPRVTGTCLVCFREQRDVMRLGPCKEGCEHYKPNRRADKKPDITKRFNIGPAPRERVNMGGMTARMKRMKITLPDIRIPKGEDDA
jgi:hypothetical protein